MDSLTFITVFARWCNGSTADSGSVCHGSNPCRAANLRIQNPRRSPALPQNCISSLLRNTLMECLIAHHHWRRATTGQALHKLDGIFAVACRLGAVSVWVEAQPITEVAMQF